MIDPGWSLATAAKTSPTDVLAKCIFVFGRKKKNLARGPTWWPQRHVFRELLWTSAEEDGHLKPDRSCIHSAARCGV